MIVDVATLQREHAEQRAQIAQLVATVAKLSDRIAELLAVAQRKQRKPAGPTGKAAPPPVIGEDAQKAFDSRPKPPELPDKTKAPKREPPRTGRNTIPGHLETEEHSLRPSQCGHCGSSVLEVAEDVVEKKLHVVKEHQRRRIVRRTTWRCRVCLKRTTPASLPAPYAPSKVTSD